MDQIVTGAMRNGVAEPYDFTIGNLIKEAWHRVHGSKITIWGALLYIFLISLALSTLEFVAERYLGTSDILSGAFQIASLFITFPLTIGLQYLGVRRSVDLPIAADQIFSMYNFLGRLIGMFILQAVVVYALTFATVFPALIIYSLEISALAKGLLMLIPIALGLFTLYINMSFVFSYLLIVEKGLGVWAAYKTSYHAYSQHWFKIIVAVLAMLGIYVLSALALLIGLIWTIPMLVNFTGILYRTAFGVEEVRKG